VHEDGLLGSLWELEECRRILSSDVADPKVLLKHQNHLQQLSSAIGKERTGGSRREQHPARKREKNLAYRRIVSTRCAVPPISRLQKYQQIRASDVVLRNVSYNVLLRKKVRPGVCLGWEGGSLRHVKVDLLILVSVSRNSNCAMNAAPRARIY
jgi:hypothetical protein